VLRPDRAILPVGIPLFPHDKHTGVHSDLTRIRETLGFTVAVVLEFDKSGRKPVVPPD
jgi:hypothetical protein